MKGKKTLFLVFLMSVIFSSCENTLANLLNEKMGFEVPETFREEDKANAKKIKIEEKKQNDYNYIVISNAESFDDSLFDKYFRIYFTPVKGEEQKGSFCTYLPDSNVNIQTLSATNSSCGSVDSQGFFKIEKESPFVFKIADKEKQLASQYGLVFKYKGFSVNNVLSVEKDSFGEDDNNTKKFNIKFDSSEDWSWHWCPDEEFSLSKSVPEKLNYLTDYIEFTIKGTPNMDVYRLGIQVANDFGTLTEQFIPAKFTAKEKFEKKVRVSLFKNYDPSENYHLIVCYDPKPGAYNNFGLEINNFSVTAYAVKNVGFTFTKDPWTSDFDNSYCYNHRLNGETWFAENHSKKYVNVRLTCNSPVEITNLLFKLVTTDWKESADFRIGKLIKGLNAIDVSFGVDSLIPLDSEIMYTGFSYLKEDVDKQLSLTDVYVECSFTDEPLYQTINTDNSYDSGDGYSFSNGTLTITDSVDADFFNNKSFSAEDVTTLNIQNNVQTIPSGLFTNCKNLEAVNVSSPLKTIESGAFLGLTKLKIVNIPDSVESIGDKAFYDCSSLECIVIPENTVSIGEMAFASSGIKILLVQENVQSIGAGAFQNCSSLEVVYIHENSKLQSFSSYLFSNCESLYQISVYIEADTYQSSGFKITSCYWNDMGTIGIPSSINEIDYRAFYNCKNLTQVTISSSVTSISSEAFLGTGLTTVTIPSSVTSIGREAFPETCSVYVDWYEEQALEHEVDSTVNVIYKPRNQYSFNNGSLELNQNIGSSFFTDNQINSSEVTNIIIGKNVTVIDNETFKQCKNLTTVDFSQSENLTVIGEKAFYGCPVEEIDLSGCKDLTTIGNYAFSNCAGLTKVTIPESVKKLGSYTFSTCSSLTEVVFSGTSSLTELGSSTFYNCKQLQNLTLPDTIKGLGGYNFYGCINLPSIILSEGVAESQYDGQGINGDNNFKNWPKEHPVYLNYTREQDHNSSRRYGDATIVYKDEKVIIVEYISDNGTAGILESYASGASSQSSLMQVSSANKEFGGWYTEPELINKVEDVPGLFRLQQSAATSDNTNPLTGGVVVRLKLYAEWKDLQ